jgi:glutamate formiminotransferase
MKKVSVNKEGFILRAVKCNKCNSLIIHPKDEQEYNSFKDLKKKEYNVKMRFIGNSYAVSIPREIVNFIREQEKIMDDMVKLCFEESGKISLNFHQSNHPHIHAKDKFNKDKIDIN